MTHREDLVRDIERGLAASSGSACARLSDEELDQVIAECEQCPYNVDGASREATVWRWMHSLADEVRDARALAREGAK